MSPTGLRPRIAALYLAFFASGFSGLIYESIWTQYLKLFLGHAAYAQTAVLAIFMGGMAAGAWLAGRLSSRMAMPLRAYAVAEALVALAALAFHGAFGALTDWLYGVVLPEMGSPEAASAVRWTAASLSILPQSILLGATFPLMSAGVLRFRGENSGRVLATLYFVNSLGAAIGVMVAGFVLVPSVGLPGALLTAGLINAGVALAVWFIQPPMGEAAIPAAAVADASPPTMAARVPRLILWGAALTGATSFFYEIGWIRMLSMVLGSSTHAFELMLSAFILGIALGGAWVRRRIARVNNLLALLGVVQLVMGASAMTTLWLYDKTFAWMSWGLAALARTDAGYLVFGLGSHVIAMAIMVPVTFCAGVTLPAMTEVLLRRAYGEQAVGQVYAYNTVGSIAGILVAIHGVMPVLGVHGLIVLGGFVDMALGLVLLVAGGSHGRRLLAVGAASLAATGAAAAWGAPDARRTASGVFRTGLKALPPSIRVEYYEDGKTATVSLRRDGSDIVSLATNGKVDASINMAGKGELAGDEFPQILLGALPLALHPQARNALVIGLGSGTSSHVLLSSPAVERVDTVEIEPKMAEAARRGFQSMASRTFADPRSHLVFDDAKSYLAVSGRRYDVIVSEPSNPWVSGVASLFTREFYAMAARHLETDGVLVQWIQAYETDLDILASIVKAMRESFPNYAIYAASDVDLVIVARKSAAPLAVAPAEPPPALMAELRRLRIGSAAELSLRRVADARLLDPLVDTSRAPANSDYFPWVDLNAPKARFRGQEVFGIPRLGVSRVPLLDMLDGPIDPTPVQPVRADVSLARLESIALARRLHRGLLANDWKDVEPLWQRLASYAFDSGTCQGTEEAHIQSLVDVAERLVPNLTAPMLEELWSALESRPCWRGKAGETGRWLQLVRALGRRDGKEAASVAESLLGDSAYVAKNRDLREYLFLAAVVGRLSTGDRETARSLWAKHSGSLFGGKDKGRGESIDIKLLRALSWAG